MTVQLQLHLYKIVINGDVHGQYGTTKFFNWAKSERSFIVLVVSSVGPCLID